MKKSMFLVLLLSLCIVSACTTGKTQSLEAFYRDAKIEHVDKVIIQDGTTGKTKEITAQEQIDDFLSRVKDIVFTPQDNQDKRVGWRYGITLLDGKEEFKFTLSKIGDTYYDSNPDIYPIVEKYYNQLKVE